MPNKDELPKIKISFEATGHEGLRAVNRLVWYLAGGSVAVVVLTILMR